MQEEGVYCGLDTAPIPESGFGVQVIHPRPQATLLLGVIPRKVRATRPILDILRTRDTHLLHLVITPRRLLRMAPCIMATLPMHIIIPGSRRGQNVMAIFLRWL